MPNSIGQDPNGAACCSLVTQAPGQKEAIITSSSEPRRVEIKPLTSAASLPVWDARQELRLSQRGDLGLAGACDAAGPSEPPCVPPFVRWDEEFAAESRWSGQGLRPARPLSPQDCQSSTVSASPGDPRSAQRRGREALAERDKVATRAVGIRGRSRPTSQHATLALRNALSPTLDPVEP